MIQILFFPDPDLESCTSHQKKTYLFLKDGLLNGDRLKVGQVLEALGLSNVAPLVSRLNHLQQKGLIKWGREETPQGVTA